MGRPAVGHRMAGWRAAGGVGEGSGVAGLRTMKRVLVTGATGGIGRHAVPHLVARGWEVHAVSSSHVPGEDGAVVWHRADLLDPAQADLVIRVAAPTHLLH